MSWWSGQAWSLTRTDRPARYLRQLCRHFGAETGRMTRNWTVTHDDARGVADFGRIGRCTFEARADGLLVRVTAADPVRRRLLQRVVGDHLERFGRRDGLTVHWRTGPPLDG